jgi:hypothetical protein
VGRSGTIVPFGVDFGLDSLPDVIAGIVSRLEQETGLICNVLEIAHESGAVFAGFEVLFEIGIFRNAVPVGCEEIRKLLLKIGTGKFASRLVRRHFTVSLRLSCGVDGSG